MPKTRLQKEETVTVLRDKFGRAKSVVFADYRGLTMVQLSDLRKKLREQNAEFSITKNNLLKLALKSVILGTNEVRTPESSKSGSWTSQDDIFKGPTATLFSFDDEISPIKLLVKAFKDASLGEVKAGLLGDDILDKAKVSYLATLPSKDELRGKTVGVLVAPLHGIVGVLQANLRNLVYALDQIRITKGGE